MTVSRTTELSNIIAANTGDINSFLTKNGLPQLSFDSPPPQQLMMSPEMRQKRESVIDAAKELADLMQPPQQLLIQHSVCLLPGLQATCRFGISDILGDRDEISYEEIAAEIKLPVDIVRRLLYAAMACRIFRESRPGYIAHTAASRVLCGNPVMSQFLQMTLEEVIPSSLQIVEAISRWPDGQEPNHAGFNIQNRTETPFFDEISKFPDRASRFATAMAAFDKNPGFSHQHLVASYPWTSLGKGTIVDVGGSTGHASVAVARAFPDLNFVVQDRPEVLAEAIVPSDLEGRIKFQAHDFFTEQPVKGADAYFLRWILHDWSDEYCILILRALIPALVNGSKVILQEYVLSQPGQVSNLQEQAHRRFDMLMLGLHNGKERLATDWKILFARADSRFHLTNIVQPPGSNLSTLEVIWKDDSTNSNVNLV